tara:strand:- start:84 stop:1214 length:1131 start_codon:yes stop_codon:yes gene_type:complete
MNNYNLNSSSYNLTELENLFGLLTPYTVEQLEGKKVELRDKIIKIPKMESTRRKNILIFLDNISNRLLDNLTKDDFIKKQINKDNPIVEKVNPDVKYTIKLINIDSIFRNDYYNTKSSNFTFTLPDKITKVIKMGINNLQIPVSNYAISSSLKNNKFDISYNNNSETITIPDGNYSTQFKDTAASIELTINNLLKNCSNSDISNNVKFCVDKISGKSIFTCDNSGDLVIDFTMNDINNPLSYKLGWLLGFRAGKYNGPAIISEGICHIIGSKYIFLGINDYQNNGINNFIANFNESTLPSDIMTRLNIAYSRDENGVYNTTTEINLNTDMLNYSREYFGPVDLQKFTFTLYDHFGRIIDLNNMDWSLVLTFTCQFD